MAGDSNTGGGGSVYWNIDATQVDVPDTGNNHTGTGRGNHHQHGKDNGGALGTNFTVTIRVPDNVSAQDFINSIAIVQGGRRIVLTFPIVDDKNQIRIQWN